MLHPAHTLFRMAALANAGWFSAEMAANAPYAAKRVADPHWGDKVRAQDKDGWWYPARVVKVGTAAQGHSLLHWDGGYAEGNNAFVALPFDKIREAAPVKVGERVWVHWGKDEWYEAKVQAVNGTKADVVFMGSEADGPQTFDTKYIVHASSKKG